MIKKIILLILLLFIFSSILVVAEDIDFIESLSCNNSIDYTCPVGYYCNISICDRLNCTDNQFLSNNGHSCMDQREIVGLTKDLFKKTFINKICLMIILLIIATYLYNSFIKLGNR